ncbi:MAG: hypothetical protein ACP5RH_17160, partial [Leptodesmis sp.]|uniref:hypothetical protein n=1 Tax=Leptodesmis sp. TaxID=3100501 RepID=UPI003D0AA4B5
MRLFYGGTAFGPRERPGRLRQRQDAERAGRNREQRQARGHRPAGRRTGGLSRADIIDTAIAIADAEGTEAVSMRRIARDLRVGAMSLY